MKSNILNQISYGKKLKIDNTIQLVDYCNVLFPLFNCDLRNKNVTSLLKSYKGFKKDSIVVMIYDQQKKQFFLQQQSDCSFDSALTLVDDFYKSIVKQLGIDFYECFHVYENDNTYFMNIEGEVKQFVDEDNCPQVKNGLFMLLNKELNIKQKMPNLGDVYFYKVVNLSTKEVEIKNKSFIDSNDMINYNNNNCFSTRELCEKFANVDNPMKV